VLGESSVSLAGKRLGLLAIGPPATENRLAASSRWRSWRRSRALAHDCWNWPGNTSSWQIGSPVHTVTAGEVYRPVKRGRRSSARGGLLGCPLGSRRSGRPSNNGSVLPYDPVMGRATRRRVLLGFDQPVQSLSGGKFNAEGAAFSAINRLDRLLPARSSRQFNVEHPSPRAPR
jgi:hypothetical protein